MPRPSKNIVPDKLQLASLGELYDDLLAVQSWLNNDAATTEARSLLRSYLLLCEPTIRERVGYLARKRGLTQEALWLQILKGEAEPIKPDEIVTEPERHDE